MSSITLIPKPNKNNIKNELCSGILEPVHTGLKEPIVRISAHVSSTESAMAREFIPRKLAKAKSRDLW